MAPTPPVPLAGCQDQTHRGTVLKRSDHAHRSTVPSHHLHGVKPVDMLHPQLPAVAAAHQRVLATHERHAQHGQGVVTKRAQRTESAVDQLAVSTGPAWKGLGFGS